MARTTTAKNQMGTFNSEGDQAFSGAESGIAQYNANLAKLNSGQNVGANPFQSTPYLSNVNKLQSEALDTSANSGKAAMQRWNVATGGLNRSQVPLAQRDIALQSGRLGDTLSAQRASNDYRSNLQWQQYLAGAPLAGSQLNTSLYGTATGGANNSLNNYTTAMDSNYGNLTSILNTMISGGAGMGAAKIAGCWIAEALYGIDDPRTLLLRSWLNREFRESWIGDKVMGLYLAVGERVAKAVRLFRPLGWILRPLFEVALRQARRDRKEAA